MECVYWVITMKCNDFCDHCYNNSGPGGEVIDKAELLKVVPNLPSDMKRLVLSGGEPLMELGKLLAVVKAVLERFGPGFPVWLQTNGDLMTQKTLSTLLQAGIKRIDITSLDRFHQHQGGRRKALTQLFTASSMQDADSEQKDAKLVYKFWGANEDIWLGGNWARGRALENDLAYKNPDHNFCSLWSGAKSFLEASSPKQEVHIQLYRLYPCCPTTLFSLGDVRKESIPAILARTQNIAEFQSLNRGDVEGIGVENTSDASITRAFARKRIQELGDVCLWCDEYFDKYYTGPKLEKSPKR